MVGFPHSEIPGSKLIRSSPRLIAAYYVLHRLHAPRHPLDALKALDRSHYRCPQHHRPLLKGRLVIGPRTKDHVLQHGRLIGQIKKNQNSRALAVSPRGCRVKQAARHLFTMSKDPAAALPIKERRGQTCSLCATYSKNGGAGRDRTDDILLAKQTLSQLSYGPFQSTGRLVGPGGLEPPTSRLSGVRSNHLSYGPLDHARSPATRW
jgi:hypothetical protein